jgi:uncharacterized protein (TIGR03118 family)
LQDLAMNVSLPFARGSRATLALAGLLAFAAAQAADGGYVQRNLVSDGFVPAEHTDANLVNPWGIAFNPSAFAWVADNGGNVSTLYDGAGQPQSLVVAIPAPGSADGGAPTGVVFNASAGFVVHKDKASGPSRFLFATEDGLIAGWSPAADATHALVAVDRSAAGAVYKGIALGAGGSGQLLYATDFHNARVDVFDANFNPAGLMANAFADRRIPAGFAPFGIQAIGGDVYVTYAKQDAQRHDDVAGAGLGYVDVYDADGHLLHRVASRGALNAPWGIALAPAGFGPFGGSLLIGNFGDGRINAYDPVFRFPLGGLRGSDHRPIQIQGLWGIAFGNGFSDQPADTLFFAAGPGGEAHGLYGRLDAAADDD